ncbi:protein N-terminal glutamine amidohydrolase-like [Anabrus simplex]|uniref:protein N-terminal glutamine amidohydrolase-like n=1 Tax=Anabrus simplex TaxID=316456 RepID=UPI0035A33FDF
MASVSHPSKIQRQDTGVVTNTTKKPILNLFSQRSDCKYTPAYCEENVWKLCQDISTRHSGELQHCYVVFVSNDSRTVPLWRQKAGKEEEKLVIWDYHELFLYTPDDRCLVYDLDSELPYPTYLHKYVTETFRTDHILKPEYFRYFRVISASLFLQHFASDRRHMKRSDGSWIKPPPDYPPITSAANPHNLDDFINMDPTKVS